MSEKTRRIRVEFGPFRIVLEGFDSASDGVEMAVQLIRNLSAKKLAPGPAEQPVAGNGGLQAQPQEAHPKPEKPLLLQEDARAGNESAKAPEFHTIRLDTGGKSFDPDSDNSWRADIERLEASAQRAVKTLTGSHDSPGSPQAGSVSKTPSPESHGETLGTGTGDTGRRSLAQDGQGAEPATPETETDGFSPRVVANADIQPGDSDPDTGGGLSIQENMDINRRAIEQAAAERNRHHNHPDGMSHDYLAMEDKAIDRLLETTNALLETDDHTRKNQSLDRLKAAVVATEAERRIRVKTATGTVTLDFDEKGGTRRPVADLLTTPNIDPEKRRQRLQDYRQLIAEHKKRT